MAGHSGTLVCKRWSSSDLDLTVLGASGSCAKFSSPNSVSVYIREGLIATRFLIMLVMVTACSWYIMCGIVWLLMRFADGGSGCRWAIWLFAPGHLEGGLGTTQSIYGVQGSTLNFFQAIRKQSHCRAYPLQGSCTASYSATMLWREPISCWHKLFREPMSAY